MSHFAKLVKAGLQYSNSQNDLRLDSIYQDDIKAARDEQMARITGNSAVVAGNGLRADNGYKVDKVFKVDSNDVDPMIAARAEQTARIAANNR